MHPSSVSAVATDHVGAATEALREAASTSSDTATVTTEGRASASAESDCARPSASHASSQAADGATASTAAGSAVASTADTKGEGVAPRRIVVLLCAEMHALATDGLEGWRSLESRSRCLKARGDACFKESRWQQSAEWYTAALFWAQDGGHASLLCAVGARDGASATASAGVLAPLAKPRGSEGGGPAGSEGDGGGTLCVEGAANAQLCVVLLSSRAEARLQVAEWQGAISDCEAALRLNPDHARTISRLERARQGAQSAATAAAGSALRGDGDARDTALQLSHGATALSEALLALGTANSADRRMHDSVTSTTPPSPNLPPTSGAEAPSSSPVAFSEVCVSEVAISEVCVYWLPIATSEYELPEAAERVHGFLNAAADLLHAQWQPNDAVLICSGGSTSGDGAASALPLGTKANGTAAAAAVSSVTAQPAAGAKRKASSQPAEVVRSQKKPKGAGAPPAPPPPPLVSKDVEGEKSRALCALGKGGGLGSSAADGSVAASTAKSADGAAPTAKSSGGGGSSGGRTSGGVAGQVDALARACAFAHAVRWRSALPSELIGRSGVRKGPLRELLAHYQPMLFSISLFESAPGSKSFAHYAAATVAFVTDKVRAFGGCDFRLHLNSGAATHTGLLRRLHEVALGRIAFVEYAFVPRPRVAPWLLAGMRLAPLLEVRGRTVVTTDIHDDLALQNAQINSLLVKLRKEGRELCLTWWLAEDAADDCLINAALPVARLRQYVSDRWHHTSGSNGGLGLHAHMDAGMNIATGYRLRDGVLAAHDGLSFLEFITGFVRGATSIPHGIEEMAWDAYLNECGWPTLLPRVLFSVHRSLLAGRDTKDPFCGVQTDSEAEHAITFRREELDIGKAEFGVQLPTCRHSQALDCAEDSATWLKSRRG